MNSSWHKFKSTLRSFWGSEGPKEEQFNAGSGTEISRHDALSQGEKEIDMQNNLNLAKQYDFETRARVRKTIEDLVAVDKGYEEIADHLANSGFTTPNGKRPDKTFVSNQMNYIRKAAIKKLTKGRLTNDKFLRVQNAFNDQPQNGYSATVPPVAGGFEANRSRVSDEVARLRRMYGRQWQRFAKFEQPQPVQVPPARVPQTSRFIAPSRVPTGAVPQQFRGEPSDPVASSILSDAGISNNEKVALLVEYFGQR